MSKNFLFNFTKKGNQARRLATKTEVFKPFNAIPGPSNANSIGDPKNLHNTIHKMHTTYGPIFRIKLGEVNAIFVSSSEHMREIFRYEGKYPKHPLPSAWLYFNKKFNCKRGLFFMDDDEWLRYRKILNPMLLQNFNRYRHAVEMACDKLIDDENNRVVANRRDKSLRDTEFVEWRDLEARLYRWSIDVVINVLLGTSNDNIIPQTLIKEFGEVVHKIFEYSVPLQAMSPLDFPESVEWEKFAKVTSRTLELGNQIIDKAIENCPLNNEGLLNQFKEQGIAKEDMRRLFTDLIVAAGDTTSFATQWALYLVAKNEETQEKLRQSLSIDDFEKESELIKGAIRETLRLYPPATFIGRITAESGVIGNYEIPKGTLALLSLYTSGRNEKHFSQPFDFIPERWLRDPSNFHKADPQASLPYAIGARSCIGRKIANYQMHTLLTKILINFDMKLLNKKPIESVMKMVITPKETIKIGLKMRK
ncbi:cytochrome P450 315a1, mitochondrial [Culicoides brevitarsis]|uniref:cytochrome P450 315a1, mitochondrial n=1 Tax=Culicoides brevitarsis TaxID=469753 RepID=UPI00307C52B5